MLRVFSWVRTTARLQFFGRVFSVLALALGLSVVFVPTPAQAANSCSFRCEVQPTQGECSGGSASECPSQCRTLCAAAGMTQDTSSSPTCQNGGCRGCLCIPNVALACSPASPTGATTPHRYCSDQCDNTCETGSAAIRRQGSSMACSGMTGHIPLCQALDHGTSVRLCQRCANSCVTGSLEPKTRSDCFNECTGSGGRYQCQGVTMAEAFPDPENTQFNSCVSCMGSCLNSGIASRSDCYASCRTAPTSGSNCATGDYQAIFDRGYPISAGASASRPRPSSNGGSSGTTGSSR